MGLGSFFLQMSAYQFKVAGAEIPHVVVLNAARQIAVEMIFGILSILTRPFCFAQKIPHRSLPLRGNGNLSLLLQRGFFLEPRCGGFGAPYPSGFRTLHSLTAFFADACHVVTDWFWDVIFVRHICLSFLNC